MQATTNHSAIESQDPRTDGQNGPKRRQLLLQSHRPRHAQHRAHNLPRHKIATYTKQSPRMGTKPTDVASDRGARHRLHLVALLRHRHGRLLPRRPPSRRESRRLLHHVRGRLVPFQHCHVGGRRGCPARHERVKRRHRHVGLGLQGQQAKATLPRRHPLRPCMQIAGLVVDLLHYRSRG